MARAIAVIWGSAESRRVQSLLASQIRFRRPPECRIPSTPGVIESFIVGNIGKSGGLAVQSGRLPRDISEPSD